ncbi:diguanylate cyclase [Synechococcus sp. 65AY6A5]|uniref:diguanylate cyclase domain-containing protein n=1 Tax=Synechococcus sp. 65AY6A5 TaxID=1353265 RepID=UPI000C5452A8|nr:GGDEF domain-containing protein [Synechococcus sp. 65AY6A5]PIK89097.1 diguanylate cyclase [Synechococcus sp. 65AY6A5]
MSLEEPTTCISLECYGLGVEREPVGAFLTVLWGANMGMTFPLGETAVVGRSSQADIQLWDHAVSRQHCRLEREGGTYILTDLGSLNGTYVNWQRVTRLPLADRDRIQLGNSLLQFAYYDRLEEAFFFQVAAAALYDPLTGLHNRRFFLEHLQREMAFARRHSFPLHLLYLDLDNFKLINDRWGHLAGDQALIQVARQLQDQVRQEDLLARMGGDEFALLVRGIPDSQILQLAGRLQQAVQSLPLQGGIPLTCSIGVASLLRLPAETSVQSFLEAADQALYQAKRQGGSREVLL